MYFLTGMDLEDSIDVFQQQTGGLDIEDSIWA
jgi:hypothetical protein